MRKLVLPLLISGLLLGLGASASVPPHDERRDAELAVAQADFAFATTNWGDGVAPETERFLLHALAIRQRFLNPGDARIADVWERLGALYYNRNAFASAEADLRKALAIDLRARGENNLDTLHAMGDVAAALREQNRLGKAEALATHSLHLRRTLFPGEKGSLVGALDNLARIYLREGRYAQAHGAASEELDILQSVWPPLPDRDVAPARALLERIEVVEAEGGKAWRILLIAVSGLLVLFGVMTGATLTAEAAAARGRSADAFPIWPVVALAARLLFQFFVVVLSLIGATGLVRSLLPGDGYTRFVAIAAGLAVIWGVMIAAQILMNLARRIAGLPVHSIEFFRGMAVRRSVSS